MFLPAKIENPKEISSKYPHLVGFHETLRGILEERRKLKIETEAVKLKYNEQIQNLLTQIQKLADQEKENNDQIEKYLEFIDQIKQKVLEKEGIVWEKISSLLLFLSKNRESNFELEKMLQEVDNLGIKKSKIIEILQGLGQELSNLQEEYQQIKQNLHQNSRHNVRKQVQKVRQKESDLFQAYLVDLPEREVKRVIADYKESYWVVCLVHGIQPIQELNYNSVLQKGLGDLDLLRTAIILGPTLATSTFRRGDEANNRFTGICGVIIGGGTVEQASSGDGASKASCNGERVYLSRPNLLIAPAIAESINNRDKKEFGSYGYDEFNVANPGIAGIYIDFDRMWQIGGGNEIKTQEQRQEKLRKIRELADEFELPLFYIRNGELWNEQQEVVTDISAYPIMPPFSREEKIDYLNQAGHMFLLNNEKTDFRYNLARYFEGLFYGLTLKFLQNEHGNLEKKLEKIWQSQNPDEQKVADKQSYKILKEIPNIGNLKICRYDHLGKTCYSIVTCIAGVNNSLISQNPYTKKYQISLNYLTYMNSKQKDQIEFLGDSYFIMGMSQHFSNKFYEKISSKIREKILQSVEKASESNFKVTMTAEELYPKLFMV
jgi:hypothetical protein